MALGPAEWLDVLKKAESEPERLDELSPILSEQLRELCFALQKTDADERLVASPDLPGYLYTDVGSLRVFVPWPLAENFPSGAQLIELLRLAREHDISALEDICLSGSSAGGGNRIEIGDIDYCQYTEMMPPSIVIHAERYMDVNMNSKLISLKYGNSWSAVTPLFEGWDEIKSVMLSHSKIDDAERFMLDFLATSGVWGPIPLSTVVLSCDFADRSLGVANRSFVYQEAVITRGNRGGKPIWGLVEPREIARYLKFLFKQIEDYKAEKPLKALKRALSLAYTIQLFSYVDRITDLLLSDEAASHICCERARESGRLAMACQGKLPDDATQARSFELDAVFVNRCVSLINQMLAALRGPLEQAE